MHRDALRRHGLEESVIDKLVARLTIIINIGGTLVDILDVGGLFAAVVDDKVQGRSIELNVIPLGFVGSAYHLGELRAGPFVGDDITLIVPSIDIRLAVSTDVQVVVLLGQFIVVQALDGNIVADIVGETAALGDEREAGGIVVAHVTSGHHDGAVGALRLDHITASHSSLPDDAALVGQTGGLAGQNHVTDVAAPFLPVLQEHAGCTRQAEDEGRCSELVAHAAVVALAVGVVVIDEGHGIAVDGGVASQALVCQCAKVARAKGFVELVFQGEVEGGRGLARAVDPPRDGLLAVPELTHAELRLAVLVVHLCVFRGIALHHVETETHIPDFFEQELAIGLAVLLHILAHVVKVASS